MIVGGLDPGVRSCGVAVVQEGQVLDSRLWSLPRDLTPACVGLKRVLERLVEEFDIQVLAFEDFHFHGQRGAVSTAKAMYHLLGVVRSLQGYREVRMVGVQAGRWGQHFTGQKPPPQGIGRRWDEWKAMVGWHVAQRAGPTWSWVNDRGYHRRDALGIAYYMSAELGFQARIAQAIARQESQSHG